MKVIPREAKRITYSTEIRNLKEQPLTCRQKSIIVGSVLGDGSLCTSWVHKEYKASYRLKVHHAIKQSEYVFWKYENLQNFVLSEPRIYDRTQSIVFQTISHPEITALRTDFYPNGQKRIPVQIEQILRDNLILAVWFMDDGNAIIRNGKNVGYNINSQSFSYGENKALSEALRHLYGIDSIVEKNKNKFRLAIWRNESRTVFRRIIEPHFASIPSMVYKLG